LTRKARAFSGVPFKAAIAACASESKFMLRIEYVVWVFRWGEEVNGQRRQHKDVIGTTKEFPTEAAANKEADRLRCRLPAQNGRT